MRRRAGAPTTRRPVTRDVPRLVHLTTTDMSLDWLLGPQLRAFRDAGYEVIGMSAAGPHVDALRRAGIEHVEVESATRAFDLGRDLAALRELTGLFWRLGPDIVHTHNPKPGVYGRLAARAAGVPVVVNTQHGLYATADDAPAKRAVVYSLEMMAGLCSDAELIQNVEDRDTLARLGLPESKLTVIGNGIDLSRFGTRDPARAAEIRTRVRHELGVGPDDLVVGVVGRLVVEKGYREVFAAAGRLGGHQPPIRLVVIGPTDLAKADAITEADLDAARRQGVTFLGARDDVEDLYLGMDLYVLASHREGFPRSAMEAAASGLPIVATDIRGCRQVVDDGVTGRLVPVRDPARLARAVAELAGDPGRRRAIGAAAAAKAVREFDQAQVIATTLATYRRLLGGHRPPGDGGSRGEGGSRRQGPAV